MEKVLDKVHDALRSAESLYSELFSVFFAAQGDGKRLRGVGNRLSSIKKLMPTLWIALKELPSEDEIRNLPWNRQKGDKQ